MRKFLVFLLSLSLMLSGCATSKVIESPKIPVLMWEVALKDACLASVSSDVPKFGVKEALVVLNDGGLKVKECAPDSKSRLALKIESLKYEQNLEEAKTIWNLFAAMTLITLPVRLERRYVVSLYSLNGSFKIEGFYESSVYFAWPLIPVVFFRETSKEMYARWSKETVVANRTPGMGNEQSVKESAGNKESSISMEALIARESYNPQIPMESLGAAYSSSTKGNTYEVRYCPDNTCEILKASKKDKQAIDDFAFIYFARVSSYANLQSFQKIVPDEAIEKVRSKYSSKCVKTNGAGFRCQLKEMALRFKIKLLFSRFDEGVESLNPILLKD